MGSIGMPELMVIMVIVLIVFGAGRLPQIGENLGKAIKNFKMSTQEKERLTILQGTLDLLILQTLAPGPQHGWAISERVQQVSSEVLSIRQGSLYPALHRMEEAGWLKGEWIRQDKGRRLRVYRLKKV